MKAGEEYFELFDKACDVLFSELMAGEVITASMQAENSTFVRFNRARVRQIGQVERIQVGLVYFCEHRTINASLELGRDSGENAARMLASLESMRQVAGLSPEDPWQVLPVSSGESRDYFDGQLPSVEEFLDCLVAASHDFAPLSAELVGIHSQGVQCKAARSFQASTGGGSRHYFATLTFCTDWSAWLAHGKASKATYSGRNWRKDEFIKKLEQQRAHIEKMGVAPKVLAPGHYRAWISPEALFEFMEFFSWNGLGERCIREGESSYLALRSGESSFSNKFTLTQDFSTGLEPRFNQLGELAPQKLCLIDQGTLVQSLVSSKTALQYSLASNAAPPEENLRCPTIGAGTLQENEILKSLNNGLFVSNLHYLNWSDSHTARVTGMTRYACFWVEGGRIVSPIKDMRFDVSLYHLFGKGLMDLGAERATINDPMTYEFRALAGASLPGILVEGLPLTL